MTVYELRQFLKDNWVQIKESILSNEYKAMPVRRVRYQNQTVELDY